MVLILGIEQILRRLKRALEYLLHGGVRAILTLSIIFEFLYQY